MTTSGCTIPAFSRRVALALIVLAVLAGVPLASPHAAAGAAGVDTTGVVSNLEAGELFARSTEVAAADVGGDEDAWPVTGELAIAPRRDAASATAPLPEGARLTDVELDVAAGRLQGSLVIPPGSITRAILVDFLGKPTWLDVTISYEVVAGADLVVAAAGDQIVVEPLPVQMVVRSYTIQIPPYGPCTFGPFDLELTGAVDATGLHLVSAPVAVPAAPVDSCAVARNLLLPALTLAIDIAGPAPVATTTQVATWFPAVTQFDNTFLVATVSGAEPGATPVGSVVFRDGDRLLATVPLRPDGRAALRATMTSAGTRTLTAEFLPGQGFAPSTASTQVVVTGVAGRELSGTVTIGDTPLAATPGSVLRLATDQGGASVLFAPDVADLVIDGEPVQAEVRLIQIFDPTVETAVDGTVTDLDGGFLLHVRSVTTSSGTVFPTWCVNGVVFSTVDGVPTVTSSRAPLPQCTGIGEAVVADLVGEGVADLVASPG